MRYFFNEDDYQIFRAFYIPRNSITLFQIPLKKVTTQTIFLFKNSDKKTVKIFLKTMEKQGTFNLPYFLVGFRIFDYIPLQILKKKVS